MALKVEETVTVPLPADEAFAAFVDEFQNWWPRDYTFSQGALEKIGIEAMPGGKCLEEAEDGSAHVWGTVLDIDPGAELVLAWQIGPNRNIIEDPGKASQVSVEFAERAGETQLVLAHTQFEVHGDDGTAYAEAMGSAQGWAWCLGLFKDYCAARAAG